MPESIFVTAEVNNKIMKPLPYEENYQRPYISFEGHQFFIHILAQNRLYDALNFNIKLMAGASSVDASFWKQGFYQHIFEIGGKGTLRGYKWKEIPSSHFQLTTFEFWYDEFGLFYDRAIIFESPGNTFNDTYFSDLADAFSNADSVHHSVGIGFGEEDVSISFIRQLNGDKATIIYLTLTFDSPLQYW